MPPLLELKSGLGLDVLPVTSVDFRGFEPTTYRMYIVYFNYEAMTIPRSAFFVKVYFSDLCDLIADISLQFFP